MNAPLESMVYGSMATARQLPSIDRLLREPAAMALVAEHGASFVADVARALVASLRGAVQDGTLPAAALAPTALGEALRAHCAVRAGPRLKRVFNLTGTVIHTNLGRAVLPEAALRHILATAAGASNLEFDLAAGQRGDRDGIVEALLCELTGAEAATVVNNNAAAVLLTLAALARGRETIVSRGELVEIGGAFRMPDVMAAAGTTMVEVGTTNRTHLADYERAIGAATALLLKVHTSNYSVQGFTAATGEAELAALAAGRGIALATDLGSGSLIDLAAYGLPHEPMPQEMLRAGCDVVTFSGDKLLGGPQAGLIVGKREAIERIRRYSLKRALRISKLPLAALEATLRLYLHPEQLADSLPTLRVLTRPFAAIEAQATRLLPLVAAATAPRYVVELRPMQSQIGSGSLPIDRLPSCGLAFMAASAKKSQGGALDALARAWRELAVPVLGRIADDRLLLDLRSLDDEAAFSAQLPALREVLGGESPARPAAESAP